MRTEDREIEIIVGVRKIGDAAPLARAGLADERHPGGQPRVDGDRGHIDAVGAQQIAEGATRPGPARRTGQRPGKPPTATRSPARASNGAILPGPPAVAEPPTIHTSYCYGE